MNAHDSAAPACDTDALNTLLRGEIAAVETYDRAIGRFDTQPAATDLARIRDDHRRAADALRERVTRSGGAPAADVGPWGTFSNAATGVAGDVGPATVLAALKQGEVHGANEYEAVLSDPDVAAGCKDLIRSDLLPKARAHVTDLDRLLAGA